MITSLQNNKVKEVAKLSKSSVRNELSCTVVEGNREVSIAQQFHFEIQTIFICKSIFKDDEMYAINFECGAEIIEVSPDVYAKLSYRTGTEGILAIVKTKQNTIHQLIATENSLILVLESIEKPGNIGAMLRTADAAGVNAIIICNKVTDVYNPNTIRSSLGCVFAMPIFTSTSTECIDFLNKHNFQILCASLQTENNFYAQNLKLNTAIVFGSESDGLSSIWYEKSTLVKLPMHGKIDSLNVSASCAAMLFEAVRQKQN